MTKTVRIFETGSVFRDILLENTPQNVAYAVGEADLGVVMPGCEKMCSGEFTTLIIPGNCEISCSAGDIITYGMAPNNTVTLSSVGEKRCVMTIQREIVTLWGEVVEPQDMVIPRMGLAPDYAMAAVSAILIAGGQIWGI